MAGDILIDDEVLFGSIDISKDDTFCTLINGISNHVYKDDNIMLDSIFDIKNWLKRLLDCEVFLSTSKKRHRDHLLHACRIALLGEKILKWDVKFNDKSIKFLDMVRELLLTTPKYSALLSSYEIDLDDQILINRLILQSWYVAALFHDIGYVYESFTESWKNIQFLARYPNFKDFCLSVESSINKFERNFSILSNHKDLTECSFMRKFDHATIGAHLICNLVGESNLVCDMAAAITDCHTSNEFVDFVEDPLSFLLILLDESQEWERPVMGRKVGDLVLSEKISKYSPYVDHESINPELQNIFISFTCDGTNSKKLDLCLTFKLEFGKDPSIFDDTNFSIPLMLYLKYKNLQRLRITHKSNTFGNLMESCFGSPADINLNFNFVIGSEIPLEYMWRRQLNILALKVITDCHNDLKTWLDEIFKSLKNNNNKIVFEINGPGPERLLSANYDEIILKSHNDYVTDSYIKSEIFKMYQLYKPSDHPGRIRSEIESERTLASSNKNIPVYGYYTCFDENIIKDTLNLISISEDKDDVIKNKQLVKLPGAGDSKAGKYEEDYAMFVPFKTPLIGDVKKDIKYKFEMETSIGEGFTANINDDVVIQPRKLFDGIYNGRRDTYIEFAKLVVKWDKNLFDDHFKECIVFKGDHYETHKLLSSINDGSYDECNAFMHIIPKELDEESENIYKFKHNFAEIAPYEICGFAWCLNE